MKTRIIVLACMVGGIYPAVSQTEFDDVYFTRKDRGTQALAVNEKSHQTFSPIETSNVYHKTSQLTPVEGYSGRTINPDYQPGVSAVTASSYFTPNYQPTGVNNQLNSYPKNFNNYSNCYCPNSYYGNRYGYGGYYSPYGLNSFGYSPFSYGYGGYYSPFSMGLGYSPFGYGSGFSMFPGMYSSMYSGMGMGLGYGFGSGYYGSGYLGYGGYYPTNVVVVNNPDTHINKVYGKRQVRSSDYANNLANHYANRGGMISSADQSQGNRSGRVASGTSSNAYYQRGWRQDPSIIQTTTSGARSGGFSNWSTGTGNSRSSWGAFDSPSRGSSNFNNSNWGGSRGSFGGGGGSFGGGSSSGGGHSSGGTRGRN